MVMLAVAVALAGCGSAQPAPTPAGAGIAPVPVETEGAIPAAALAETANTTGEEPAPAPAEKAASGGTEGMATGQVKAIEDGSIQLSTDNKELVIEVTGGTRLQRLEKGSVGDIQPGQLVTVQGAPAEDGAFTAQMVAIGDWPADVAPPPDVAPGTPAAAASSAATAAPAVAETAGTPTADQNDAAGPEGQPGNAVSGQVVAVAGDTVQVSPANGVTVTIKVTGETWVQKMVQIRLNDLEVGEWISVLGTLGTDGKITATSIEAGGEADRGPPPAQ